MNWVKRVRQWLQDIVADKNGSAVQISTQTVDGVHVEASFILNTNADGLSAMLKQSAKVAEFIAGLPNVSDIHYDERISLDLEANYYGKPDERRMKGVIHALTEEEDGKQID